MTKELQEVMMTTMHQIDNLNKQIIKKKQKILELKKN